MRVNQSSACTKVAETEINHLDVVMAEVEPLQRRQIGKSVDADAFDSAFAHVQVFQPGQRREVPSIDGGTVKRVAVEIQLNSANGDIGWNSAEIATRTVDDVTGRVTEARLRTPLCLWTATVYHPR